MDELEFRDQLLLLAEPIAATPKAVDAVVGQVGAKRRRRVIGIVAVVAFAVAVGGAAASLSGSDSDTLEPIGPHKVELSTFVDQWGVRLIVTTSFDEDRRIVEGGVGRAGSAVDTDAYVWPHLDSYVSAHPYPFVLPAGTDVTVEATVTPNCGDGPPSRITLAIRSELGGANMLDRLEVANPEEYLPALSDWCDRGLQMMLSRATITVDGKAHVAFSITNPGPRTASVVVPAFSADGATWAAASTEVPPGETVTLRLEGTGVSQAMNQPVPWTDGRMRVGGRPFSYSSINGPWE
jgi:hypothetical protein